MNSRKIFAKRLKILRKNKGFTQKELGSLLNVTDAAVGMWEQARRLPDPEILVQLADLFNCSVDWLLGRVSQDETHKFSNSTVAEQCAKYETVAAHRSDDPTEELPPEAQQSLKEFKEYILKKYSKK